MELLSKIFGPLTGLISDVLESFHSWGAPWWLSIVLLTVLVRAVLFPLTIRQVKNMRAMQELKPDMDSIRARYKDDRQKQQEAIMNLYRERRVNPLAGFLPILVQIPVFITMYRVIRNHEETFPSFASGGLLWFVDLTRADPYFILPVLSASILFVAGGISSRNVAPGQRSMMRLMPIAFTAFIARFPAGLFVYWVTSNTITLVQNYLIYNRTPPSQNSQAGSSHPADRSARRPTDHTEPASKPATQSVKNNSRRKRRKKKKK
ncbi:MAG: membrane protein insertase YidC [Actinomycetota bacterium]|nr:membrane protein insertase YidC [Actinomycetota bacterium]